MRLLLAAALVLAATAAQADAAWDAVLARAKGETVYWNAWGGDERTNAFIAWVGDQLHARYGVDVKQVKLTDTGEAVARIVAEKGAGRDAEAEAPERDGVRRRPARRQQPRQRVEGAAQQGLQARVEHQPLSPANRRSARRNAPAGACKRRHSEAVARAASLQPG